MFEFDSVDQPNQKIRRTLVSVLTHDEFKYFTRLEAYKAYVDGLSNMFYKRMAKVLGNNQ